jgi:hypothetical protein
VLHLQHLQHHLHKKFLQALVPAPHLLLLLLPLLLVVVVVLLLLWTPVAQVGIPWSLPARRQLRRGTESASRLLCALPLRQG